jgi:hypothetical protein
MLLVDAVEPIVVARLDILLPAAHIPCSVQHQLLHTASGRNAHIDGTISTAKHTEKSSEKGADLGVRREVLELAKLRQVTVPGACLRGSALRRVATRRLGRAPRRDTVEVAPHPSLHPRRLLRRQMGIAARRLRRRHGGCGLRSATRLYLFGSVRSEDRVGGGWIKPVSMGSRGARFSACWAGVGGFFVPLTAWVRDGQVAVP